MYSLPPTHTQQKISCSVQRREIKGAVATVIPDLNIYQNIYLLFEIDPNRHTLTRSDVSFQFSVKCKVGVKVLAKKEDFK